jgi:hypothetical protein
MIKYYIHTFKNTLHNFRIQLTILENKNIKEDAGNFSITLIAFYGKMGSAVLNWREPKSCLAQFSTLG